MTDYVIIVAGGKGLRMGSDIPKQFLPIGGKPVLMHTMLRFQEALPDGNIILVLPKAQQDYWQQLCQQYQFSLPYLLADGGETRFHSVQHGLALIPDDAKGVVGVHDGVRPFPSIDVIRNCYETARQAKAVIPVIPVVETIRHIIAADNSGLTQTVRKSPLSSAALNVQSAETHHGHGHESDGDEGDAESLQGLGHVGILHFLANGTHSDDCQSPAEA